MSIFREIRRDCERVVRSAEFSRLTLDNADGLIRTLAETLGNHLTHTEEHHLLHQGTDTIAYFLILDSVNFGSGYFPYLKKLPGMSGYFAIASALKNFCLRNGVPSSKYLQTIMTDHCAEMFAQDASDTMVNELMSLFARALNQLGDLVEDAYSGKYENIVIQSEGKAENVVRRLAEMPFFNDVHQYNFTDVRFFKRAQIFVQDIVIAEPTNELTQFEDINDLTAFADNVIPYVLRCEQILQLDPDVDQQIERGDVIESGSMEEIEMRASAVVATHAISQKFLKLGHSVPDRIVDFLLWNHGQQLKKVSTLHRHRTPCVYY